MLERLLHNPVQFFQTAPIAPEAAANALWLIIALPLLGAFICGVFGKTLGRANVNLIACCTVLGSFLLSVLVFWTTADFSSVATNPYAGGTAYAVQQDYGVWFSAGNFTVHLGLLADHLSGTMLLVITGIGFLIHLYSTEYMSHDEGYWRFFAYLNLFVAMMLTLVLGDSLVLLFVGWEGVGMCSYLLIGFWYDDAQKAFAGRKAFITNRIGDFGFLVGSFLLVLVVAAVQAQNSSDPTWSTGVQRYGPLGLQGLEAMSKLLPNMLGTVIAAGPLAGFTFGKVLTAILLCFLLGAAGKSAQLPLYVWLPDAMAGPTPVSALIHAATMVTAGVYLFCRLSYLLVLSPTAMATVAVVGGLTAFLAALIAFAQEDLKKVLAYSTVSQLGFMFMGVGAGIFWASFLHVITHAFFKACLFLGAGSVMHGNADEGGIWKLGGLRKEMKWTTATFIIATIAITGVFPLSGFFSKDAILDGLHHHTLDGYPNVLRNVWLIGVVTALCTAFYMWRLYFIAFEGERAKDARVPHAHESGPAIKFVLVALALGSVLTAIQGWPNVLPDPHGDSDVPKQTIMENFMTPVFAAAEHNIHAMPKPSVEMPEESGYPIQAWVTALIIAWLGIAIAFFLYRRYFPERKGQPLPPLWAALKRASFNKFYVDEIYNALIITPLKRISLYAFKIIDSVFIDTIGVRGTAWVTERAGSVLRYVQTGDAQSYAAVMALALAVGIGWALLKVMH
ncbi:MAG: NADH-quinone oxidoreductase subunit L [Myxococcaceae bacterium]